MQNFFQGIGTISLWVALISGIIWWFKHDEHKTTKARKVTLYAFGLFIICMCGFGLTSGGSSNSSSQKAHQHHVHTEHVAAAKHEAKIKTYEASPQYKFTKKLPKSVKASLMNDTDGNSGDKPFVEGQFDAKPYNMNVFIKVPADNYSGNSTASSEIVDAIDATKKYNLSNFKTIKFTIETPLQNDMGNSVGYIPVDWYSFKVSDLKKMNADNMTNSDLAHVAVEHGSKPVALNH